MANLSTIICVCNSHICTARILAIGVTWCYTECTYIIKPLSLSMCPSVRQSSTLRSRRILCIIASFFFFSQRFYSIELHENRNVSRQIWLGCLHELPVYRISFELLIGLASNVDARALHGPENHGPARPCPLQLRPGPDGQAELTRVAGYTPRWFTRPQTVTHPNTNRARCRDLTRYH